MNNNNNKPSKAQRKAQSQRDKAAARGPSKKSGGKGQRKQSRGKQLRGGPQGQAAAAAAYATGQVGRAPAITMSRDNCRIQHRELITSVSGSSLFKVLQTIALNPGLATSFPWLSIMAQGWEQYRFRKLKFCYYTRTGSNIPGSVILAPDYDAADAPPVSEQVASAFEDVAEDAPWKDIECVLHRLSMAAGTTRHFTRTGALAANLDIKTYDVGNLHVCTVDGDAVNWGKLWVEYDVEFFVPQLPPGGVTQVVGGTILSGGGATTAATPMGAAPIVNVDAQAINAHDAAESQFYIGREGTYLVNAAIDAATTITAISLSAVSGCTVSSLDSVLVSSTGTRGYRRYLIVVTGSLGVFKFQCSAATVTHASLNIATAPYSSLD